MKASLFFSFLLDLLLVLATSAERQLFSKTHRGDGRQLLQENVLGLYQEAYQDTTTQLRNAILDGDLAMATSLLTVIPDVEALGAGLRFPPGQDEQFDIVTPERTTDPDVITIKAVAGASLRLGDCEWISSSTDDPETTNPQVLGILKLASVVIIAITPDSGVFPEEVNQFRLQVNIINMLADRGFMQLVVDDNPLATTLHRKLLVDAGVPVSTWFCSMCYPNRFCRNSCWWCEDV